MIHDFKTFPVIISERFILRQLKIEDAVNLYKLRSDKRVNEFINRIPAKSIADVEVFIDNINKGINDCKYFYWTIGFKNTDKVIGTICLWNIHLEKELAEIGFELLPEYQGLGIMSEAVDKVIQYGFNEMNLKTISAVVRTLNYKSIHLLEKKGFIMDVNKEISDELLGIGYELYYLLKK